MAVCLTVLGFCQPLWGQPAPGRPDLERTEFFPPSPFSISEAEGPTGLTLVRPTGVLGEVTFTLRTREVTAQSGRDFEPLPASVLFAAEQDQVELEITPIHNLKVDGNRTFTLEAFLHAPESDPESPLAAVDVWINDHERAVVLDASFGAGQPLSSPLLVFPDDSFLTGHEEGLFHWDADGREGRVIALEGFEQEPATDAYQFIEDVLLTAEGDLAVLGFYEAYRPNSFVIYSWIRHYSMEGQLLSPNPSTRLNVDFVAGLAVQADGKIVYIGANENFQTGSVSTQIGRVFPGGSRDTSFESGRLFSGYENSANALVSQSDGSLLVGGSFSEFGGEPRAGLVRLSPDGVLDPDFEQSLDPSSVVHSVVVLSDDRLIIAGRLVATDGTPYQILQLSAKGDVEWQAPINDTETDGVIQGLLLDPERDRLYAFGDFHRVGPVPFQAIARFDLATQEWDPSFVGRTTDRSLSHRSVRLQSTGHLISRFGRIFTDTVDRQGALFLARELDLLEGGAGGELTVQRLGSSAQPFSVRLGGYEAAAGVIDGALPETLDFAAGQAQIEIAVTPIDNGRVEPPKYLPLTLESANGDPLLSPEPRVEVRIRDNELPNRVDQSFRPRNLISPNAILPLADGRIAVATQNTGNPLQLVSPDGEVREDYRALSQDPIRTEFKTLHAWDESWALAGGWHDPNQGIRRPWLGRIHLETGDVDPKFTLPRLSSSRSGLGEVTALAVQTQAGEAKILAAGSMRLGGEYEGLLRLLSDGSVDEAFASGNAFRSRQGGVMIPVLEVAPDGTLVVGGLFDQVGDLESPALVRLTADGVPVAGFQSPFRGSDEVFAVRIAEDGSLWVSARFDTFAGGILRLLPDGSRDPNFVPITADERILSFVESGERGVFVLGNFNHLNGLGYAGLGLLRPNGQLDTQFVANGSADEYFRNVGFSHGFVDAAGGLVLGGRHSLFDGLTASVLSRLLPDADPGRTAVVFHHNSTYRSVSEGSDESLELTLLRLGHTEEATPYSVIASSDQADPLSDYQLDSPEGVFEPLAVLQTLGFTPLDDGRVESVETVQLAIAGVPGERLQTEAEVHILDNEQAADLDYAFSTRPGLNGSAFVLEPLDDGRLMVGGVFDQFGDVAVPGLARMLPKGGLDPSFAVEGELDGLVRTVALVGDRLWVGGSFRYAFGEDVRRQNLIWLSPDGAADPALSEVPEPNSPVWVIEPEPDGGVLLGGEFRRVGGETRNHIARLDPTGQLDEVFGVGLSLTGFVRTVLRLDDGKVLVGGDFDRIGPETVGDLVRLTPEGAWDPDFAAFVEGDVVAVRQLPDQSLLVAGRFHRVNDQARGGVVRLFPDGTLDTNFDPPIQFGSVAQVHVREDQIAIAGSFDSPSADQRYHYARLSLTGELLATWPTFGHGGYLSLQDFAFDLSGTPILSILQDEYRGLPVSRLLRLNLDQPHRTTVNVLPPQAALYEPEGHVTLTFQRVGDLTDPTQLRLTGEGRGGVTASDYQFESEVVEFGALESVAEVRVLVVDDDRAEPDGSLQIAIESLTPDHWVGAGTGVLRVVDTDRDGGLDSEFRPVIERASRYGFFFDAPLGYRAATIQGLAVQRDQSIVIFGDFDRVNGVEIQTVARLLPDGELDLTYRPDISARSVQQIGLQSDDRLVVAGVLPDHGPLYRLLPDGQVDPDFLGLSFDEVQGINGFRILPDDRIVVWGEFRVTAGVRSTRLVLLSPEGALDPSFQSNGGPNRFIRQVHYQAPGSLLLAGDFTRYGQQAVRGIVRIGLDGQLDLGFAPNGGPNRDVYWLHLFGNGNLHIGGAFNRVDDELSEPFATLNSHGVRVPEPEVWPRLEATLPLRDGTTYVSGYGDLGGTPLRGLGRLTSDHRLDPAFDVGTGLEGDVNAMAVMANGDLLVAGSLTEFNGIPAASLIRIKGQPVLAIEQIRLLADGRVELEVTGEPGATYHLESTVDFETWELRDTVVAEGSPLQLYDVVTEPSAFYRVRRDS